MMTTMQGPVLLRVRTRFQLSYAATATLSLRLLPPHRFHLHLPHLYLHLSPPVLHVPSSLTPSSVQRFLLTPQEYSESLGFRFVTHDIFDGGLIDSCAVAELDYVIVSYVCIYVAKQPGHPKHEAVCDEFRRLLQLGVRAILVSERSEETPACGMVEQRGVSAVETVQQRQCSRDSEGSSQRLASACRSQYRK